MKQIDINVHGLSVDYRTANNIAQSIAAMMEKEPTVIAWHDKQAAKMSPEIEGGDINTRWHDYGASHGGEVNVTINGDYDFIFADGSEFEQETPSPYRMVHDKDGHEYICLASQLRDPNDPSKSACEPVDVERGAWGGHGGYA